MIRILCEALRWADVLVCLSCVHVTDVIWTTLIADAYLPQ